MDGVALCRLRILMRSLARRMGRGFRWQRLLLPVIVAFFEGFGGGFCDVCRLLRQGRFVLHTTKKGFYNAKKTEKNKGLG